MEINLQVPFPPYSSIYWRYGKSGQHVSPEGKAYRNDVSAAIWKCFDRERHPFPVKGKLHVTVRLYAPNMVMRYIYNAAGVIIDALTRAGIWIDRQQIDLLTISRGDVVKGGRCCVTIREIGEG